MRSLTVQTSQNLEASKPFEVSRKKEFQIFYCIRKFARISHSHFFKSNVGKQGLVVRTLFIDPIVSIGNTKS